MTFLIRHLKRSSLLIVVILFLGSLSVGAQNELPKSFLGPQKEGVVYNATFFYKEHQVSGLFVAKKVEDSYHVLLLSKMGPTLLNVLIKPDGVVWNKNIEFLEKRALKKALIKDIRLMLLTPLDNTRKIKHKKGSTYKVKNHINIKLNLLDNNRVAQAENRGFINFFKSFVTYKYTGEAKIPEQIKLRHRNIKLKIELKYLAQ